MDAKELYLKETGKDRTRSCYERIPSVTEHYISWLETKVTEQHQALQLQQTGVMRSCSHNCTTNYCNSDGSYSHKMCDDCGDVIWD